MKTAIIGGGVSGLSLAYFLQSKNMDFVLFEREKPWAEMPIPEKWCITIKKNTWIWP